MSKTTNKVFSVSSQLAARLVQNYTGQHESRRLAIQSVAAEFHRAAQTLNDWVEKDEVEGNMWAGVTI